MDAAGNAFGAVSSAKPDTNGVWRFDGKTGAAAHVPGTEALLYPNGVAFDKRGNLYVTDMIGGAVWRVVPGKPAERWVQHELLAGDNSLSFGIPVGANGIAARDDAVYVGVTEKKTSVTIPILGDGSAGVPQVYAQLQGLYYIDGIALDSHGDVYVAAVGMIEIVRVHRDGSVDTLATAADGLDGPTSLTFGPGDSGTQDLYVANNSAADQQPGGPGPSLMRINVGATPTAMASPTARPVAAPSVAPAPPKTGSGAVQADHGWLSWPLELAVLGLATVAIGASLLRRHVHLRGS